MNTGMALARKIGGPIWLTALFTIAWTLGGGSASADAGPKDNRAEK